MIKDYLEFFKKVSDYFFVATKQDGSLVCKKHRIEHTGKNVYSIVIDLFLYKQTNDKKYFHRAAARALRTIKKVIVDPQHGYWIFYPGRLSGWNASNSIIDAGACVDALSEFYLASEGKMAEPQREQIKSAIFKVADSYLKDAVVSKPITNQRLWGATGLAKAYTIFKTPSWRDSLLKSVEISLAEMWADGTFPYHPNWQIDNIFPGIDDTTTYYHSRCLAFIVYILENIRVDLAPYKERLLKSADLLVAMYQPNGIKNIDLETKRWYWHSRYEVASNTFDLYALVRAYQLSLDRRYLYYAQMALKQILRHQLADGGIVSNFGNWSLNFQCRIFWTAHIAWLVRVFNFLPDVIETAPIEDLRYFSNSGILKFRNENYCVIIRGQKKPMSLIWGPVSAGGGVVYFGRPEDNWQKITMIGDLVFYLSGGYINNLKRFIVKNKRDLKEELYHVIGRLHQPDIESFIVLAFKFAWRLLVAGRNLYYAHYATTSDLSLSQGQASFKLKPARSDGRSVESITIYRDYLFHSDRLAVTERVEVNSSLSKVLYYYPRQAKNLLIDTSFNYKVKVDRVVFRPNRKSDQITISYSL